MYKSKEQQCTGKICTGGFETRPQENHSHEDHSPASIALAGTPLMQMRAAEAEAIGASTQMQSAEPEAMGAPAQMRTAEPEAIGAPAQMRTAEPEAMGAPAQMASEEAEAMGAPVESVRAGFKPAPPDNPIQRMPNNTGLPDNLKSGLENLSGISMDHVRVHYNSPKPAQLQAHAYTQGTDIHIAPGQEKHLPHEGWHVVQQAQGRVRPTLQMKGGVPVNDDAGLEREADVMGGRAGESTLSPLKKHVNQKNQIIQGRSYVTIQMKNIFKETKLNVAGENHKVTDARRKQEKKFTRKYAKTRNYWTEDEFRETNKRNIFSVRDRRPMADPFDLRLQQHATWIKKFIDIEGKWKPLEENDMNAWEGTLKKKNILWKISEAKDYTQSMYELIRKMKNDEDGYKLTREERNNIKKAQDPCEKLIKELMLLEKLINEGQKSIEKMESYNRTIEFVDELHKILVIMQSGEEIRITRSMKMHESATRRSGTRGVWKVGDAHIKDIERIYDKQLKYNIIDQNKFDKEFDRYMEGAIEKDGQAKGGGEEEKNAKG